MNPKSSAWTGRAPRSMAEAFNPYTDNTLHPMREPRTRHAQDWLLYAVAVVAVVVVGVVL